MAQGELPAQFYADVGSDPTVEPGRLEFSKWKKVDSRTLGITRSMISSPSWTVLKILRGEGFEAYLVGGCVRDLILNKIPKDFDVITTAALKQIRKKFYRAEIVGRRFPICRVHMKGSIIEVSSFQTVAKHAEEKEKILLSQMHKGCDKLDFLRWRNSMHRDFTINSLFFDPFMNKIYDYANGMKDLWSLKLRTLIPAQLSFKEDCARILRGLRIAARLGLSFSEETETAIRKCSSSITGLDKSRIMMEINYMLSYGAAEHSVCLLRRFNLLEILLPFHAAYLAEQASNQSDQGSMMLMKLLLNLDHLVACDRPSDCCLWVGLLAFHLALVNNPQHPLVILTFAAILYHGKWEKGVKFARQYVQSQINFVPEISATCDPILDDELAKRVAQLAMLVQGSIDVLTEKESLFQTMEKFPGFHCSGVVFVSKKMGKDVAQLFDVLVHDVESYQMRRKSCEIDYYLLGQGNVSETRFVLGKIIMDTLGCGVAKGGEISKEEDLVHAFDPEQKAGLFEENSCISSHLEKCHTVGKADKKNHVSPSLYELVQESAKRQKLIGKEGNISDQKATKQQEAVISKKPELVQKSAKRQKLIGREGNISDQKATKQQDAVISEKLAEINEKKQDLIERNEKHSKVVKKVSGVVSQNEVTQKQQKLIPDCHLSQHRSRQQERMLKNSEHHLDKHKNNECHLDGHGVVRETSKEHKQEKREEKVSRSNLSSLFR